MKIFHFAYLSLKSENFLICFFLSFIRQNKARLYPLMTMTDGDSQDFLGDLVVHSLVATLDPPVMKHGAI